MNILLMQSELLSSFLEYLSENFVKTFWMILWKYDITVNTALRSITHVSKENGIWENIWLSNDYALIKGIVNDDWPDL